jgi:tRNA A37 threonylcarbamoyladenosine dehydratase
MQPVHSAAVDDQFERRFSGVGRLYGEAIADRLRTTTIAVIGIGGVGTWAAEALARTGCERLILVDLDHVSPSNTNRQLHALDGTYGKAKVQAMAERLHAINPRGLIRCVDDFLTPDNVIEVLADAQAIIDATDQVAAKSSIAAFALAHQRYAVLCGGAGGRRDPGRLKVADLAQTGGDPLLAAVRQRLRRNHGFAAGNGKRSPPFGVDAVYSDEPMTRVADCGATPGAPLACGGFGSSVVVTASMGMRAAACVIERLSRFGPD